MKKAVLSALALALLLAGCGKELDIKEESLTLTLGQERVLTVSGAGKKDKVVFSSSNPNVASVDGKGSVKGLGDGVSVITAKSGDRYDTVGVVVGTGVAQYVDEYGSIVSEPQGSPVDEGTISGESDITALALSLVGGGKDDVTISTDRTYEIKVTKTPAESVDKVVLRIDDPSVATVEGNILKGHAKGHTLLTATAPNGVKAEMIVRVK